MPNLYSLSLDSQIFKIGRLLGPRLQSGQTDTPERFRPHPNPAGQVVVFTPYLYAVGYS